MAPSASKQKRLAEKAAKKSAGINGDASTSTSTPTGSVSGSAFNTPLNGSSAATSTEDLLSMAKLNIATDRYGFDYLFSEFSQISTHERIRRTGL